MYVNGVIQGSLAVAVITWIYCATKCYLPRISFWYVPYILGTREQTQHAQRNLMVSLKVINITGNKQGLTSCACVCGRFLDSAFLCEIIAKTSLFSAVSAHSSNMWASLLTLWWRFKVDIPQEAETPGLDTGGGAFVIFRQAHWLLCRFHKYNTGIQYWSDCLEPRVFLN